MAGALILLLLVGGIVQVTSTKRHFSKTDHRTDNFKLPPLKEIYFDTFLDNFDLTSSQTFPLRILVDDSSHDHEEGPLVVYTGNEGSIETFANQTGQVFLLAHYLQGRPAFIEQRYYGNSKPSQNDSYRYLSTEQVLADLVAAINFLKSRYDSQQVVAVGGSYGGMLTAWLQQQHPDLITAAWASSAPLLGFASVLESVNHQSAIYQLIEGDYEPSCATTIGKAFLHMLANQTNDEIRQILNLCPNKIQEGTIPASSIKERAIGWLQSLFGLIANFDYPYDVSFAGKFVPANPTKLVCEELHNAKKSQPTRLGADRLVAALDWFLRPKPSNSNNSGANRTTSCRTLEPSFYSYNPGFIPGPWTYQHCYDLIMAYEVAESSKMFLPCSMFAPNCWSEANFAEFCAAIFGQRPRQSNIRAAYFGTDGRKFAAQNIVLTNGKLDPWSFAGIGYAETYKDQPERLPRNVMWIDGASHHLDIWWPHPEDPPSVISAREKAFRQIAGWTMESK
jgi:lysosomal Pro-X carboxypeptidase